MCITAQATILFESRTRMPRASRSPFMPSFTRSLTFINMMRRISEMRSGEASPSKRSALITACTLAAACSGVSTSIPSMSSRASHESSTSTSETSMCCAITHASSADIAPDTALNSALSKNSAAALLPRARSSSAIWRAPRSFSKNSRRVSLAWRSASAVRAGLSRMASIIAGARIRRCWFRVMSSRSEPSEVERANKAMASSGVLLVPATA